MKNCIAIVVVTGLIIVQGSPSFKEVFEYNDELDNVRDNFKRTKLWEHPITPVIGPKDLMDGLKNLGKVNVNSDFKVPHPVDEAGKIADIIVSVAKLSSDNPKDLTNVIPHLLSIEKDLEGIVKCHNFVCNIVLLGLNITVGYDAPNKGLYLYIEFLGSLVLHDKLPTTGLLYCEPVQLPLDHVKFCIHADNLQLGEKRACLDLGFSFLSFSHVLADICLH